MIDELQTLNPDGSPPLTRIKDAESAYQIWNLLRMADAISSYDRARIDSAYDDTAPLDQSQLTLNNQSYRVNVSWGFANNELQRSQAGYIDVINSVENLFECPTTYGSRNDREEREIIVANKVTDCIRSWRDFIPSFLRLTAQFIKHGVGIALFRDEYDWRFDPCGLSDFKIPRKTPVGQENIDVACRLKFYSATQLYKFIENPERAEELGFNVEAIKNCIIKSIQNSNTFTRWRNWEWEKIEIELKNNDYFWTYGSAQTQSIRVVHMWYTEFDGTVTYAMLNDDEEQKDFLYRKIGRFSNSYESYIVFTYGIGNDYYHGIRGQGYSIFPKHQTLNRAYCQLLELASFGCAPTFQPSDESSLEEMNFIPRGAYNLLTPGINVLPNTIVPNLSNGVLPIINEFTQLLKEGTNTSNYFDYLSTSKEQTATQVDAIQGQIAKMSISTIELFYDPWESLLKEVVRRMKRRDYDINEPGGKYILGLHKRLLEEGGSDLLETFFNLDVDRLKAKRAIGAGSDAARAVSFNRMMTLWGSLDDVGKQNLLRDLIAQDVGYRNANRYVLPPSSPGRPTIDVSIAELQNDALMSGGTATVKPNDNQLIHCTVHANGLIAVVQQCQQLLMTNPNSAGGLLQGAEALSSHLAEHLQKLSQDPKMKVEAAQFRKVLEQGSEVIHNGILHFQKLQSDQQNKDQQQGNQESPQGGIDQITLAKLQSQQAITQAKIEEIHQLISAKTAAIQAQTQQKLAIEDAKSAQDIKYNG